MVVQMTATEIKAKLLAVLDAVAEGAEVEITKHGKTVARLIPAKNSSALKGSCSGIASSAASDEDLFATGVSWEIE